MAIRTNTGIKTLNGNHKYAEGLVVLSEGYPYSGNLTVRDKPLRIIAWGLTGDDYIIVNAARIGAIGSRHWALTDDCCPCVLPPSPVVNVDYMPYLRCGNQVKLTAASPFALIDDTGSYFLEFVGSGDLVTVEYYDDLCLRKSC